MDGNSTYYSFSHKGIQSDCTFGMSYEPCGAKAALVQMNHVKNTHCEYYILANDDIELCWTIGFSGRGYTTFLVTLKNISGRDLYIDHLSPFVTEKLDMNSEPSERWIFFRQGRHKNDLPSVCTLGIHDERYEDALGGLTETGIKMEATDGSKHLISDQLTVIKSSEDGVGLLLGFDTGDRLLTETVMQTDSHNAFVSLEAKCLCNFVLRNCHTICSETLRLKAGTDMTEAIYSFAHDKALLYNARKGDTIPSVYSTWYYYGSTITEADVVENLQAIVNCGIPFDVFQLDDGWEINKGDWAANEKFPHGMKHVADKIKKAGLIPGIWTSPFITAAESVLFKEHSDWFLYDSSGKPCIFPMNQRRYNVLDITNPDVILWLTDFYRTLTFDWGYTYHKLDFTRAAVIQKDTAYYNPHIPLAAAYRQAIAAIRRGMGESSYLLMCGGLYDPIIGLVDGQRTGSDVLSMWSNMQGIAGKVAPFTIKQNALRFYMNEWWDNDPDSLMVRRQTEMTRELKLSLGLLNDEEVKTSALNQYLGGGIVCSTEPMAVIDDNRLSILRHIMPVTKTRTFLPGMFRDERYPSVFTTELRDKGWSTVSFINWSDTEQGTFSFELDEHFLGSLATPGRRYVVSSFFGKYINTNAHYGDIISLPGILPHGCEIVKVALYTGQPVVVGSNGHYSIGSEFERLEVCGMMLYVTLRSAFDYALECSVYLPDGLMPDNQEGLPDGLAWEDGLLHVSVAYSGMYEFYIQLRNKDAE